MFDNLTLYINETFRTLPFTSLFYSSLSTILFRNVFALGLTITITLSNIINKYLKFICKDMYKKYPNIKNFLGKGERPKNAINCGCFIDPNNPAKKSTSFGAPSGHAQIMFTIATFISLSLNNKLYSILLYLLAVYGGYTRIMMNCHTLSQVIMGAIFGVIIGYLCFIVYDYCLSNWKPSEL